MNFLNLYQSNLKSVKSSLTSLWCSEASTEKQKGYAEQLKELIDKEIFDSEEYEPLVQSMEYYESSTPEEAKEIFKTVDESLWKKSQEDVDRTNGTFSLKSKPADKYFKPYKHQVGAWKSLTASDWRSMVVTTGTGSGKTECFMIPLVNELLQSTDNTHSVKAIFLYPLNALMEDQKERLQKLLDDGGKRRLTFAVYNGNLPDRRNDDNEDDIDREKKYYPNIVATRDELHRFGADIILTNPTMLEYMLIRDKDQHLFESNSLRWIVVDEAHTFTGAAATELAMLLRRVLNAFGTDKDKLHFAASSATMGNSDDKAKQEKELRKFISDISGISEGKIDVIKGNRNKYTPTEDTEFTRCKKTLTDVECDYIKLSELLPNYNSTEERLKKLDEFCEQGLRAKVHFFYRVANSGIRVQLDKWADKDKGILKLQSLMPLDPKATPALEAVRCEHCGEYIAIGEILENKPQYYRAATDSNEDLFDLNEEKTNRVFFGVVPTKEIRKEGNEYVSINGDKYQSGVNPDGEWAIVVNTNRQCPHCSAKLYPEKKDNKDSSSQNQEDPEDDTKFKATRLRISAEFIARLMAPGLLDNMKQSDQTGLPHKGQQYISFVDSRQAAAKGTFRQNVEVERDWVFSRVFHKLLSKKSQIESVKRDINRLNEELKIAMSSQDISKIRVISSQLDEKEKEKSQADYLSWEKIYELLRKDPTCNSLCRQFANQTNEEVEGDEINQVVKDRYIFAIMLSNLAKYPPFQASAETMGLLMSYYPKLEKITELPEAVVKFNANNHTNITLEEWKNLLKIYLDRTPRSNESIYLEMRGFLHCDIFNCSERFGLQRPPHRTARIPSLPDNNIEKHISLIPLLLAKVIDPDSLNLIDVIKKNRDDINTVIEAMWEDLKRCELLQYSKYIKNSSTRKSLDINSIRTSDWKFDEDKKDDKIPDYQKNPNCRQLRLNVADIAFKLPEHVFYCEIAERGGKKMHIRPTYTTFCGYSPYPKANVIEKPIAEKEWNEMFDYINGEDTNHHKVSLSDIETWLKTNRPEMYEYGLLGDSGCFNTRVLSVFSYPEPFIQAEHTAQVEKDLSRKTQELFKAQKLNILACSTTMEMGVDLGNLELVVMASIPPHPANYKQRAGRSGRNDATRSACITLCSSDAVGHRVLRDPMQTIIKRQVEMPFVDWDSPTIIQRHVNAFLYRKSGIFFSDDTRSSLNWSIIDIFSNYIWGTITRGNGTQADVIDYWTIIDNNKKVFPKQNNPLGQSSGTRFEKFAKWLEDDANPADVEFLLKDTGYSCSANQFIDKCHDDWRRLYKEIEIELSYYGGLYEEAYEKAKNNPKLKSKVFDGELKTQWGLRLRGKFNEILKRRLIDYLATHRFTPNANMPVDVVEFDIYHNKKDLNQGKKLRSNPSYSLQQALSQYAPGNMVVKENRVIRVAGAEYYGKDTSHDRTVFFTDGVNVVGAESERRINDFEKKIWPVSGRQGLELIQVKSFIPDINAQDSRVMDPSPYTTVNAYLVGAEDWEPSGHHLMSARCNLDAGEAKIMYYNDGIGFGYCMCPACGKMELEKAPCPSGNMKGIPSAMISESGKNNFSCHYSIYSVDDNGKPKLCIPPRNKYYRNVIIGGLIQTDFCEMEIKKVINGPSVNKKDDKSLLTTLGLALCRAFTEHIGKDRESVDFTIMMNGNLCIFDTNPGGSGYSNKLSETHIRLDVIKRAKDMLDSIQDKEEILDKFTVRYLNDIDIDAAKEWMQAELNTWDSTPSEVRNSRYESARWSNFIDILKEFNDNPDGITLFCNDDFDKWNYSTSELTEVRKTWEHRLRNVIKDHSTGSNKVDLLIPTNKNVPTQAYSVLPQNGWAKLYSTSQLMDDGFYPLAYVNGHLYFTDDKETASMNGDWAKGSVFCINNPGQLYDFSQKHTLEITNNASTCVFYLNSDESKACKSTELAEIVLKSVKEKGLDIDGFFQYCKDGNDIVRISYIDEHFKSVTGMITTMHFIDVLLQKMNRRDNFHVTFVNEKYYTASSEVYSPWLNIEKWERRNTILERLANDWMENTYHKSADEAKDMWENDCRNEKSLAHWRVLSVECGNKKLNIYPHGGIINEWVVDRKSRRYAMTDTTKDPINLIRTNPIMYIVEIEDK